jgi:hypothetical protein
MRRTVLADRVTVATRARVGQTVMVDLRSVPATDSRGRIAHVVGIRFAAMYDLVVSESPGYLAAQTLISAAYQNIFLEDIGGWIYLAGLSGADLIRDNYFRNWMLDPVTAPVSSAVLPGSAAGNRTVDVSLSYSLIRNDRRGSAAWDGAIPLAALQAKTGALRFTAGNTVPGGALPANTTLTGFSEAPGLGTINVFLDLVYLPVVVVPNAWQVENYTVSELSGSLRHADRMHEYATLIHRVGDDASQPHVQPLVSGYGGITVSNNGDVLASALSAWEFFQRDLYMIGSQDQLAYLGTRGYTTDSNSQHTKTEPFPSPGSNWALADDQAQNQEWMMFVPQTKHGRAMASGQIGFNITQRAAELPFERFLHRTIACHEPYHAGAVIGSTGCPQGAVVMGLQPNGVVGRAAPDEPIVAVPDDVSADWYSLGRNGYK